MSKSRGNTIELRMSADETAKILKKAKTDAERRITFDPEGRPEVSNLLMLASLATGEAPEAIADRIGDAGAGTLKALVTESLNEMLAPLRSRRAELIANEDYLLSILHMRQRARQRTGRPDPVRGSHRHADELLIPLNSYRRPPWHTTSSPSIPTIPSARGCSLSSSAGIPVVGFVYLLVLALGSGGSPSKRNFARALFIWQIIGIVATILMFVLFGGAIMAGLQNSGY